MRHSLQRTVQWLLCGGIAASALSSEPAQACGGLFCSSANPVNQAAERIIFAQEGGRTSAVIEIQYQGPAERFAWVQTLDREKIAQRLSEQRPAGLPPLNVLIQVNASQETSKSGLAPRDVPALAEAVRKMPRLKLRGLMAIPEPGAPRERYREVKSLFDSLREKFAWDTLSMGMSDDLELAIAEGATLVRIGTAIFGARERSAA